MKVIRCAKLDLSVELPALMAEVAMLPDRWKPHFQKAHYDGEWTANPLRSLGGRAEELLPFALGGVATEYAATPLLGSCPGIARFLDSLACPVMSARLLNLKRGAVIKPHRDAELAFENGEARLHVPIFMPRATQAPSPPPTASIKANKLSFKTARNRVRRLTGDPSWKWTCWTRAEIFSTLSPLLPRRRRGRMER